MILYLETSDLVKLYIQEKDSGKIKNRVQEAEVVATSMISLAEARAAFSRKWREKELKEKEYKTIKGSIQTDWEKFFILNVTEEIIKSAGNLAEKYGLRGFDAIHLASALFLKKESSSQIIFSSSDNKLTQAAEKENLHCK